MMPTGDPDTATNAVQIALLEQRITAVESRLDTVATISHSVAQIEVKLDLLLQERNKAPNAVNYVSWGLTILLALGGWIFALMKP